ncbi:MAG: hypothetical protein KDE27_15715 [Planctomycetes bacterium]|nr:hypothetical protein [Planctomycetota bacterium]
MDASDWEPLPPEKLGLHPGEAAELRIARSAAAARLTAEQAAAAEVALNRLRQKIASAPAPTSLVGHIEQREQRQRRRAAAATVAGAELRQVAVHSDVTAADVPLAVEYARGEAGRDPREDEAWFRALPQPEQQRLHAVWAAGRARQRRRRWRPVRTLEAVGGGLVISGLLGLLSMLIGATLSQVGLLIGLGALGAGIAQLCGGGRFAYACVGVVAFFGAFAPMLTQNPSLMIAALLLAFGFGALGMEQEMRRSGGFDSDGDRPQPEPPRSQGTTQRSS